MAWPNKGMEVDSKKLALFKTTHAQRWSATTKIPIIHLEDWYG